MLKKNLHLILFLFFTSLAYSQTTSVIADWDGTDLAVTTSFGNGHFGDSTFAVVANPNASGINTSANVQNWQKADNAMTWGGFFYDPSEAIDLTGGVGELCISAYSDHEFNLRAKIEKSDDGGPNASFDMTYNTPGEWQQLCYNLMGPDVNGDANTAGFTYTRLTLFPDFGTVPATDAAYYFDDISKTTGGMAPPASEVIADWDGTDLAISTSFGNGHFGDSTFAIVANPNPSGINTSDNVQNWQKADNAMTWGGFFYDPTEAIDLRGAFGEICLNAYSDHEFVLRAKVEVSDDGGASSSYDMTYNTPGEWQQLCYDLLGPNVNGDADAAGFTYTRITLFPDFGTVPATDAAYYFDDIIKITDGLGGGIPEGANLISDYEADGVTVEMGASFGNGHYGADLFNVIANPSPDGTNPTSMVQEWCKADDAQVWGGWNLGDIDSLDFTGTIAKVCFSVLSDSEALIRLKLEGSPTAGFDARVDENYTTPGEWQTLCFDFSVPDINGNLPLGHQFFKIVFFPGFDEVPSADQCYYFDNIYEVNDGTGMVPVFISDLIKDSPDHTILEDLLNATDLWSAYDGTDVTVFAPTDAAFNALPAGELDALMNNTDNVTLNTLLFHVTSTPLPASDLTMGLKYIARNGIDGIVTAANSGVNNATIIQADIPNTNGILHFIDGVMEFPPEPDFYVQDDFETPDLQEWFGFNFGSADANVWIEANPSPDAVNSSATVLHHRKYPEDQGPQSFQGIAIRENLRPMNFIGNITNICVDFLAPAVGSTLRWKLENGLTTGVQLRYQVESTVANQWETLCTDVTEMSVQDPFDPAAGHIFTRMAVFFDFVSGQFPDAETDYYIDNFIIWNTEIVGTENVAELEGFNMFPNPTSDVLTIETTSPVKYALVYDAAGKQMMAVANPLDKQIDVSGLPSGMYYIQFMSEGATQMGVAKFMKQ